MCAHACAIYVYHYHFPEGWSKLGYRLFHWIVVNFGAGEPKIQSSQDLDSKISRNQFIGDDGTVMCDLHLGCDTPSLPGLGASATFGDRPPPGITLLKTYPKKGWRPDIANSPSGVVCMLCYATFVGRDAINTAAAALRKWLLQNFAHSGIEDICTRMREHASQHTAAEAVQTQLSKYYYNKRRTLGVGARQRE
ncbi:hypothetical protein K438DRAFT_1754222 [Mycena galopus ATCC 62051]|nr:hypothetical protein K438DRAFT_1754222 [Mycena galopus ATCC 62051]